MKIKHHLCLSVSGALKNWTKKEWAAVAKDNNTTADHVKEQFRIYDFESKKVIPFNDPCDGFSYETGCPGHEVVE